MKEKFKSQKSQPKADPPPAEKVKRVTDKMTVEIIRVGEKQEEAN